MVSLTILVSTVIVFYVSSSIASPRLTSTFRNHMPEQRTVLLPGTRPFLGNSHGSVHFQDTKKLSRKVNPPSQIANNKVGRPMKVKHLNNVKRPSSKSPFRFPDDTPILFPNTNSPSINQPGQNTNAWFDGGMEQRMLMPRGYSMPEELYGPNYIWDTKGWPRLIETTPRPVYNRLKNSTNDSPIIFKDNPSWPLHFPTISHPQMNKQNNYQNNFIEEKPNSSFEADSIESRISLPEGYKTPNAWDKKGWPKFAATTPKPPRQDINTSLTSQSKEWPFFFP